MDETNRDIKDLRSLGTSSPKDEMLYPGQGIKRSQWGFIAPEENLVAVLRRDQEALKILSYTNGEVAALLEPLMGTAVQYFNWRNSQSARDILDGKVPQCFEFRASNGVMYVAEVEKYIGGQPCPWGDKTVNNWEGAVDFFLMPQDEFSRASRGKSWNKFLFDSIMEGECEVGLTKVNYKGLTKVSGLMQHLIGTHGFYEGSVPWRCAPEVIVKRFGVEKSPGSIEIAAKLRISNFM